MEQKQKQFGMKLPCKANDKSRSGDPEQGVG